MNKIRPDDNTPLIVGLFALIAVIALLLLVMIAVIAPDALPQPAAPVPEDAVSAAYTVWRG